MTDTSEWYDIIQTMQFLNGISMSTLYRRINADKNPLPAGTKMGGQKVYWSVKALQM